MEDDRKIRTRDDAFRHLSHYSQARSAELDQSVLKHPLVKTYMLETVGEGRELPPVESLLKPYADLLQVDDDFYIVRDRLRDVKGFLETADRRFLFFYTDAESRIADGAVRHWTTDCASLDKVWLSGVFLEAMWEAIVKLFSRHRRGKIRFDHKSIFDYPSEMISTSADDINEREALRNGTRGGESEDEFAEQRQSSLVVVEQLGQLEDVLPHLQASYNPFYSISSLRYPASGAKGGHDFYYSGKATNRSDDFYDHRMRTHDVVRTYKQVTLEIERNAVSQTERTKLPFGGESLTMKGAPVYVEFHDRLSPEVFHCFVDKTFEKAQGPFRLSGNPIWLGASKAHIYAIDLHLWQELYVEVTPEHMLIILPEGTCGNTVHRVVTNVQRYLAPHVTVYVGEDKYEDLIGAAMRSLGTKGDASA